MKVGFVTSNAAFSQPIIDELTRRGHDVCLYRHSPNEGENLWQLGQAAATVDRVFVDWAQPPLEQVLSNFDCPIFVRAHRLEMYSPEYLQGLPWNKVSTLFFIADHVRARFCEALQAAQPHRVVVLPHVGIDGSFWVPDPELRQWEPPWRIVIAGNIVPKKRIYTAVQMLRDLPEDFTLSIRGSCSMPGYGNAEYAQNITDLIMDLGLMKRVDADKSLPPEQLREVYQRSHFVLSASNEEGCHTAVAEGMACGCVPLVNAWRGADKVYPPEWVWRSPKDLYGLCEDWAAFPLERKQGLSDAMRDFVVPRYEAAAVASTICDYITGPVDAESVGAWYSTNMLEHMIEQDGNIRQQSAYEAVKPYLQPGAKVLELGCGTGWISRQLAAEGYAAYGQDVALGLLEWADAHNPEGAVFEQGDATKALIRGPFDAITAIDVLEHIRTDHHPELMVRIAHELRPGGHLVCRFPARVTDKQIVEEKVFPKVLRKQCREAGLEVVRFGPTGDVYFEVVARKPEVAL
jgi:glycosyltransferase involved in cell wall biosynthesis/ubiquinone/menaquinone biosynthesis C-methylase UbiE